MPVTVQAQPAGVVTVMAPVPPVEAAEIEPGVTLNVHVMPDWLTVKVRPAIVTVPVRAVIVELAATATLTLPFPVRFAVFTESHATLLDADHEQVDPVETETLLELAAALVVRLCGVIE
jgi:hypothetical protein